jgi:hypothetical protein
LRETFLSEGEVESLDLLAALCALGREGSTGRAIFSRGPERIAFVVENGVLVDLESPGELSTPEVLVRSGKLQRETYDALVIPPGEDRFAIATASGVVSKKEAAWGRKISAIESLAHLLSWTEGSYVFEPLAPESSTGFRLPIDKWILELFLRSNDRALVMSRVGPTDLPLLKSDSFAPAFAALGLTADADAVASLIDGGRSVEEIVRKARADEFAVLKLLAALISLRLVRPSYEAPFPEPAETAPPADEPPDLREESVPGPPDSDPEPFAEAAEAPDAAAPIALPLFALTAPEEPEIPIPASLPEEPAIEPFAAEPPARARGQARLWIALLFAVFAAALFWKLRGKGPAALPPPAPPKAEQKASAPVPVPSPAMPETRKSIVLAPAQPVPAPRAAPEASSGRAAAPWKRTLEASRRSFEHPAGFAYAIQLELACEESTVTKALRADPSGRRIWIVPYGFRGRNCYRVLWGRYKTLPKARDAKTSVPAMFLRGGNRPAVIALPGAGIAQSSR